MKLITDRTQIRDIAARWDQAYPPDGHWGADVHKQRIAKALKAIDPETATASDVSQIIGNESWACDQACDECGNRSPVTVEVGQPNDYESRTATMCGPCLVLALALVAGEMEAQ